MSAMGDLYSELSELTYWELNQKYLNGEIDWNTMSYFQSQTPEYMAMANDIEMSEVQYVRETN